MSLVLGRATKRLKSALAVTSSGESAPDTELEADVVEFAFDMLLLKEMLSWLAIDTSSKNADERMCRGWRQIRQEEQKYSGRSKW